MVTCVILLEIVLHFAIPNELERMFAHKTAFGDNTNLFSLCLLLVRSLESVVYLSCIFEKYDNLKKQEFYCIYQNRAPIIVCQFTLILINKCKMFANAINLIHFPYTTNYSVTSFPNYHQHTIGNTLTATSDIFLSSCGRLWHEKLMYCVQ